MDKEKQTVTEILLKIRDLYYEKYKINPSIVTMTEEYYREALSQHISIISSTRIEKYEDYTIFGMKIKLHDKQSFILSDGVKKEEYIIFGDMCFTSIKDRHIEHEEWLDAYTALVGFGFSVGEAKDLAWTMKRVKEDLLDYESTKKKCLISAKISSQEKSLKA